MRIVIIGGGWFGNYLGYKFKDKYKVTLLEEQGRVMMNVATKNQNRLHLVFHYPRSERTIIQSKLGFEKFKAEFPFLTRKIHNNIYSISKYSQVSPEDYVEVMDRHDLSYTLLSRKEEKEYTLKNVDLSIRVDEEIIQSKVAQKYFSMENSDIVQLNSKVSFVDRDLKKIYLEQGESISYDILINATYSHTNQFYDNSQKIPLKFEY